MLCLAYGFVLITVFFLFFLLLKIFCPNNSLHAMSTLINQQSCVNLVCYQGRVRCRSLPEQFSYLHRRPAPIQHRDLPLQCCSSHHWSRLIQSTTGSGNVGPPRTPPPTTHIHTQRFEMWALSSHKHFLNPKIKRRIEMEEDQRE